jgi:hypothetical protein
MPLGGGFDTSNASVREHRSPQGEKRKATTKKEYTTHRKMGKREARREIKKTLSKPCFETAFILFAGSVFRHGFLKWWWEVDSNHRKRC